MFINSDKDLMLSGTPFTMLFDQESAIGQPFELVIDVSENEFSSEEYIDLSTDVGSDSDYFDESLVQNVRSIENDTVKSPSNTDGANVCVTISAEYGSSIVQSSKPDGVCQLFDKSGKRQCDADSSDECLEDSESRAGKKRFRFSRESVMVIHPVSSDRNNVSNSINLVDEDSGERPGQLSGTAGEIASAGIAEYLQISEFCNIFCQGPKESWKDGCSEDSEGSSDGDDGPEHLTGVAEHTDDPMSVSLPCLHENVNEQTEVMGTAMPAPNVLDRLGPEVHPRERLIVIIEQCEKEPITVDGAMSQQHSNESVTEAEFLSDECESPSAEMSPHSSNGVWESSQISLFDSPEKSPQSLPATPEKSLQSLSASPEKSLQSLPATPDKSPQSLPVTLEKSPQSLPATPEKSQPVTPDLPIVPDVSDNVNCRVSYKSSGSKPLAKVSEPYISNDPEENNDNSDPKWKLICNLRTDDERYELVRERWKNLVIPNPNKNLTRQNYRKCAERNGRVTCNVDTSLKATNKRKRKRSLTESFEVVGPLAKRFCSNSFTCTSWFNAKIDETWEDFQKTEQEHERRFNDEFIAKWNALANGYHPSQNNLQNRYQLENEAQAYTREMKQKRFNTHHNRKNECVHTVEKYAAARNEIITFQNFYCGLKNSSNHSRDADALSNQQVSEMLDQEHTYNSYDKCYQ